MAAPGPFDAAADLTQPIDYTTVKGKNALITGGASGLGAGIATMLAMHGARVVIVDFNATTGAALEASITAAGHSAKFLQCDVTSWPAQASMFIEALAWTGGPLDIVVTSAGITGKMISFEVKHPSELANAAEDPIGANTTAIYSTNLLGSVYTAKLAVGYAMGLHDASSFAPGSKSLILVSSMGGYGPMPMAPDYSGAKYGVRGAFHSLKAAFLPLGVRVNALAPYYVATPLLERVVGEMVKRGVQFAKVEDVVDAAAHMVTNDKIVGRMVAVTAEGPVDIQDEGTAGFGAAVLGDLHKRGVLVKPPTAA